MGNCLFSCIYPKLDDNDECVEVCRKNSSCINIEELYARELANKSFEQKSCDIYTIENDVHSPTRISLNEHRISSELYETNLIEMSRDLQMFQSELSIDSGFSNPSLTEPVDAGVDILSIKIDSLSRRSSLYSKSISYCCRFISASIANMPFFLRNSIGHLASSKKAFGNNGLFSPIFIAEMKEKCTLKSLKSAQKASDSSDECEKQQIEEVSVNKSISAQATSFTTSSFRNFLLRIYDVNFF